MHIKVMSILIGSRLTRLSLKSCRLCTHVPSESKCIFKERKPSAKHLSDLKTFFQTYSYLIPYKQYIPTQILHFPGNKYDKLYLICPNVAKTVAKHILKEVKGNDNQVVAEINPGLGYISKELLDGINKVKLYEPNNLFYPVIKTILEDKFQKVQIIENDLLDLPKLAYCDSQDQGCRVESLLKDIPNKKWTDDPSMSIIGPMNDLKFIKHLAVTMILQKSIWNKGRMDLYIFTTPTNWAILTGSDNIPIFLRTWMIVFNIFFEAELLERFDKKLFMPWKRERKRQYKFTHCLDNHNMYFIKLTMKRILPIDKEYMLSFFIFLKHCAGFTDKQIIPTIEKWIPGCGKNIIVPKQQHQEYFEIINIFTKFKELTPMQTLGIFNEIISHPNCHNSPFMEMIKSESVISRFSNDDMDIVTQ